MSRRLTVVIVFLEAFIFLVGYGVAATWRVGFEDFLHSEYMLAGGIAMTAVLQVALFYNGLYDFGAVAPVPVFLVRLLTSLVLANVLLPLLYYVVPTLTVGRGVGLSAMVIITGTLCVWRLTLARWMAHRPLRRVLILGEGELAGELAAMIRARESVGYRLEGFLVRALPQGEARRDDVLGTFDDIREVVRGRSIDTVVAALAERRGQMPVDVLLDLKFVGVEVLEGVALYEQFAEKLYVRELKPSTMIFGEGFRRSDARKVSKRILDLTLCSIGLVIAAVPMLITALLVKLTSSGPAIYAQERVGEYGRVFTLYKFRSMTSDSEASGPTLAQRADPRVTPLGRFMRQTRLDELPQLFNVLRGDMSLVGPRPERPFFVIKLQREIPFFRQRLFVKPGVTGLAQVKSGYAEGIDEHIEKLQYDLAYIKNMSIPYDLQIILETVKVVIFGRGSR